jgi:hypothetical protein
MFALALVLGFAASPRPVRAAVTVPPPLPSIRHLVFNFNVGIDDLTETRIEGNAAGSRGGTEGEPGAGPATMAGSQVTAGKTNKQRADTSRKGQIIIDVVAATQDGGLVVDVSQDSVDKPEPVTRVAITQDGSLNYNPSAELTPEEAALLRLLARGVIGGVARAKGDTWDIPLTSSGYSEKTTYRVVAITAPSLEQIEADSAFEQTGIHAADGLTREKITFDPTVVVPLAATLSSHVNYKNLGSSTTTNMTIQLDLVSDSFAKKPAS